jgi:hypothetical protein
MRKLWIFNTVVTAVAVVVVVFALGYRHGTSDERRLWLDRHDRNETYYVRELTKCVTESPRVTYLLRPGSYWLVGTLPENATIVGLGANPQDVDVLAYNVDLNYSIGWQMRNVVWRVPPVQERKTAK